MPAYFHDGRTAAAFDAAKLTKTNLHESSRMFCDLYGLLPGQSQAAHAHAANDKIYSVIDGEARFEIGGERRVLGAGGVAIAPAGIEHAVFNDSDEPLTLLVVMAPHPRPPT